MTEHITEVRHVADVSSKSRGIKLLLHSKCNRTIPLPARPAAVEIEVHGSRMAFTEHVGSSSFNLAKTKIDHNNYSFIPEGTLHWWIWCEINISNLKAEKLGNGVAKRSWGMSSVSFSNLYISAWPAWHLGWVTDLCTGEQIITRRRSYFINSTTKYKTVPYPIYETCYAQNPRLPYWC